jgi:hypothetical protein
VRSPVLAVEHNLISLAQKPFVQTFRLLDTAKELVTRPAKWRYGIQHALCNAQDAPEILRSPSGFDQVSDSTFKPHTQLELCLIQLPVGIRMNADHPVRDKGQCRLVNCGMVPSIDMIWNGGIADTSRHEPIRNDGGYFKSGDQADSPKERV